jgi:hypothetical protein
MKKLLFVVTMLLVAGSGYSQSLHRDSIIAELQILKTAIIKGDKEKVAAIFSFPITDEELKLMTRLRGEKEIKLSQFDRKAFDKYYSRIITAELITCFNSLDMDKLKRSNKITGKYTPASKKDKAVYTYELTIEAKNNIRLQWNINPRDNIKIKEEDMPAEFSEIWQLKFINGKLHFEKFFAAG